MKVIQRQAVASAALASSNVPETDYAAWSSATTYARTARVIKTSSHRIYESVVGGNIGNDPETDHVNWLDVGPTNRWAMFDVAGGPVTTFDGTITLTIAIADDASALGLVDLQAASVALDVVANNASIGAQTAAAPGSAVIFDLPAGTGRTVTVAIAPSGGFAIVGKLVIGPVLDLGTTEDGPTVGITDFSRRDTDDFGVTTVVQRSYAKQLTTRCRIGSDVVDGIQRGLAVTRATSALWVADDISPGLILYGYYKDFSIDLTIGSTSFCSLTIDGLPSASIPLAVIEPAVSDTSTFHALRPVFVYGDILAASDVPENDYAAWSGSTTYAKGGRTISIAKHRVYESLVDANLNHDPTTDPTRWLDVGPTNRWAMFDQALGSATSQASSLSVTLSTPVAVNALAAMDVSAGTVRVQAAGYDRTTTVAGGEGDVITFLDLSVSAAGSITITVTAAPGGALASVGTLLFGTLEPFGVTETSPTIGITDFSKKTTDDFGNTVAIERAYAKRMEAKCLIATAALDNVVRRMASLRAIPTLWIGDEGFDSLQIYGFYRDFSATVSAGTSMCSLTIEGLTTATSVSVSAPLTSVGWTDIQDNDPDHPKPEDGATVGAPAGTDVGGVDASDLVNWTAAAQAAAALANGKIDNANSTLNQSIATAQAAADNALSQLNAPSTGIIARTSTLENDLNAGGGVKARLSTVEATLTTPTTGVLARTTNLETTVNTPTTGINARLTTVEQSLASGDSNQALTQRTSTLEAQIAGNQTSNLLSRLVTVETAYSDPTTGLVARTSTLETSINAAGTGLAARLTTAENVLSNPTTGLVTRTATLEANAAPNAAARLTNAETALTDGRFASASRATTLEAQMAGSTGSNLLTRIAATETAVTDGRFASATRATTLEAQMAGSTGSNLLTRIAATETATTDGRFASSSSLTTLSAQINGSGGLAATVSSQQQAIATLSGGISSLSARAALTLDVNGRITGYEIASNGNVGSFKINADMFEISKAGGGARTEYSDGNWRVYDSSGTQRVRMGVWA